LGDPIGLGWKSFRQRGRSLGSVIALRDGGLASLFVAFRHWQSRV